MKLSRILNPDKTPHGWCHWCPACQEMHCFRVEGAADESVKKPRWTFDGNVEQPTFSPSMLIFVMSRSEEYWVIRRTDKNKRGAVEYATEAAARAALPNDRWVSELRKVGGHRQTLCHYHLHGGKLNYCADSPHALRGKSVPLPDLPESYRGLD